jgi:hypothetical protein
MKRLITMFLLCTSTLHAQKQNPVLSKRPIPAEQMAIYRDFLSTYIEGKLAREVNINQITAPFNVQADVAEAGCLSGFTSAELHTAEVHTFAPDAFPGNNIVDTIKHPYRSPDEAVRRHGKWVEPSDSKGVITSIFDFSEIVFDAPHTHAVFTHSFVCGLLCGEGGTIIYEKIDGTWRPAKNTCGSWVS